MTFIPQIPATAVLTFPDLLAAHNLWAVYDIIAAIDPDPAKPPQIIYVDCCKLGQLFNFPRAQSNTAFIQVIKQVRGDSVVRILKITDDANEANREVFRIIRETAPYCNVNGMNTLGNKGRPLVCSNGQIYANQAEAARVLGVSQGAISRHLRNQLKRVGNHRFEYATEADLIRAGRVAPYLP